MAARFNTQANLAIPASLDAAAIGGFAVGALCLAAQRSCRASLHSNLVTITIIETRIAAGGLARARLGIATDERSLTRGHDTATHSIESIASGNNAAFRLCIAADRRQLTALLDLIAAANACPQEAESSTTPGTFLHSLMIAANGNDLAALSNNDLSLHEEANACAATCTCILSRVQLAAALCSELRIFDVNFIVGRYA